MAGSAQPLGAESGARQYQLFINGKFVDSRSGKRFESISPHDRSVVAVVAEGDKRSEEHTSELQSQSNLVCRLLLEKKKDQLPSRPEYHTAPLPSQSNRV